MCPLCGFQNIASNQHVCKHFNPPNTWRLQTPQTFHTKDHNVKIIIIKKKRQLFCVESINFLYTLSVDAVFLLINPRVISFDWSLCKHSLRRKLKCKFAASRPSAFQHVARLAAAESLQIVQFRLFCSFFELPCIYSSVVANGLFGYTCFPD